MGKHISDAKRQAIEKSLLLHNNASRAALEIGVSRSTTQRIAHEMRAAGKLGPSTADSAVPTDGTVEPTVAEVRDATFWRRKAKEERERAETAEHVLRDRFGFVGPHNKAPIKRTAVTFLEEFVISAEMIDRYLDGDLKREIIPEVGISGTSLQQTLGFDWGRDKVREDVWLDLWLRRADALIAEGRRVVQESVRTDAETAAIQDRGGLILEIHRPGVGPLPGSHKSEYLAPDPNVILLNNGTVDDLVSKIERIVI